MMPMKQLFGAVLSALTGKACSEDSNRTDRTVVLDSWWWSVDYAKSGGVTGPASSLSTI
jgi:hypothetical protein